MKPHLYGTTPHIHDAASLGADELLTRSGGNTGNLLFTYALSQMLATGPSSIPWGADISNLSPSTDRLVVPLANQLGPHVDLRVLGERFKAVDIPMIGVGLGAQGPISGVDPASIPEGSWEWLRVLASKAAGEHPNIALRGQATQQAIAQNGLAQHCVVTGCPSNFINSSATLGREINRRVANGLSRVAVAAGNPFLPQFAKLEQSLLKIMEEGEGLYICQHPNDLVRLAKQQVELVTRDHFLQYRDYIKPLLDGDQFLEWFRRWAHTFASVPEWLSFATRFDLFVGTRIHGVMVGIQAGVPSVCLCIDSRTLELCQTMNIPHLDANNFRNGLALDELEAVVRAWDWRLYDDTRQVLASRFVKFFEQNGLSVVGAPKAIIHGKTVQAMKNEAKPGNVEVHQVSTAAFDGRYRQIFSGLLRSVNSETPSILSFGCSDGFESNDLASRYFHHATIYGCDIDDDALTIAKKHNKHPSRVRFVGFDRKALRALAPFDAIAAMTVFCRWPDAEKAEDISEIYNFSKFEAGVGFLVELLKPGGVLCLYNCNYRAEDTQAASELTVIENSFFLPKSQPVKIFDPSGRRLEDQRVAGILYRKRDALQAE
jgi:2-polyprenyl-3-methyl-5-hydroxy-6-metoxy-1,4-benzoquinol methylase